MTGPVVGGPLTDVVYSDVIFSRLFGDSRMNLLGGDSWAIDFECHCDVRGGFHVRNYQYAAQRNAVYH